jgi:hypothetical protein
MPFPNEHAARQTDPGKYDTFRRAHPKGFPAGVDVIYGIWTVGGKKKSEIQTLRFKSNKWTVSQARKWLKDHGFKTAIERATKPKKSAETAKEGTEKASEQEAAPGWVKKRHNLWDGVL